MPVGIPVEYHAAQIKNYVAYRSCHGLFLFVADRHSRRRFDWLCRDEFFRIVLKLLDAVSQVDIERRVHVAAPLDVVQLRVADRAYGD